MANNVPLGAPDLESFIGSYPALNKYPFFCVIKPINSNLFCFPDFMFINDYRYYTRTDLKHLEMSKLPLQKEILKYNKKTSWEKKIKGMVFKSKNGKYKNFHNLNKYKFINSSPDFLSRKNQLKYKYLLSTYIRWDTLYWNLLSNSLTFIYEDLNKNYEITFYKYYLEAYKHYIPYTFDNIKKIYKKCLKYDENHITTIINNSTKLMLELTYDKIVNDFGNFL